MNNFPRLELHYSETPDTFTSSITALQLPELNYLLYLFIFHEDENVPHFHLINLEHQINIGIRLDTPCYYHNIFHYLTDEQKEYIYNWMKEESIMSPSKYKTSNWHQLVQLYICINSKFEEDWIDASETEGDYPWDQIFNQPKLYDDICEIPNYNELK